MPSIAAAAAVTRAWFDWIAPAVTSVSAPSRCAAAASSASLRTLLPPNAKSRTSSRLTRRLGPPPIAFDSRVIGSTGEGRDASGTRGIRDAAARSSSMVTSSSYFGGRDLS